MFQSKIATAITVCLSFLFHSNVSSLGLAQDSTRIVVTTGDAAPDGNGSFSEFFELQGPGVTNTGQATFVAELTGTNADDTRGSGIFRGDGTTGLSRIVREDQLLPTGDMVTRFFRSDVVTANNTGQFAFDKSVSFNDGSVSEGFFIADQAGGFTRIARGFDAAPDGNGRFQQFLGGRLNDAGQAVFSAVLDGTDGGDSDDSGLYVGDGTAIPMQIAREGQLAPGGNGMLSLGFIASGINSSGQTVFQTNLRDTSGGDSDNSAIYISDGAAGLTEIARTGNSGPDGDGIISEVSRPRLNDAGQVVFGARFSGATGGSSGVFVGDGASPLRTVVRIGDAVPGSDGRFTSGFRGLTINDSGDVALIASVFDVDDNFGSGVFQDKGDGLHQIALFGLDAPDGNGSFSGFSSLALNEMGQLVFDASLNETSRGDADDEGLYFFDESRGLLQIAREGEMLLGSEITDLIFNEFDNAFNDLGQVAYRFELADGRQGVALWSVGVAVPEPSSMVLLGCVGVGLINRRRKQ